MNMIKIRMYLKRVLNSCMNLFFIKEEVKSAPRIHPKVAKDKTSRKETDVLWELERFLLEKYVFRYNRLSGVTEYRRRSAEDAFYAVEQRGLNSICLEARKNGIACWDRDISRFVNSNQSPSFHPLLAYMEGLPAWDGIDRVRPLALRVSKLPVWVEGFHRWMLGLAFQWLGKESLHANSVAPVLVFS
jgi:hypothetical protein